MASDHAFVVTITDNLAYAFEHLMGTRQRKMKERDRTNLKAMLMAVVSNLAKAAAMGIVPPVFAVSLRAARQKTSRYDRPAFTGLPNLLDGLTGARLGFGLSKSAKKGEASKVLAEAALADTLARFKFRAEHFKVLEGGETIWLSRTERDPVSGNSERDLEDYADTAETTRFRKEMTIINSALKTANLGMKPDDRPPVLTSMRQLRRVFNLPPDAPEATERFDLGGRLFGGWWETLTKERRHLIRIDGERIADLDFSSMFLRLAYIEAGLMPPEGDLYGAVEGFSETRWRQGVKKVANAMFFRTSPLTRLPKGCAELLPPNTTGGEIRRAIIAAHSPIASIFETGIGLRLMFVESQILVAALLALIDRNVTGLPMHDGLMCAESKVETVEAAMRRAAEDVIGYPLPISRK